MNKLIILGIGAIVLVCAIFAGLFFAGTIVTFKVTVNTVPNQCIVDVYRVTQRILSLNSGTNGSITIVLPADLTYSIVVSKDGYETLTKTFILTYNQTIIATLKESTNPPLNSAPVINDIVGETNLIAGTPYAFVTNANDPNGDSLLYKWEWGDGTSDSYVTASTKSHIYESAGNYNLKVTVKDVPYGLTTSKSMPLVVTSPSNPPVNAEKMLTTSFIISDAQENPLSGTSILIKNSTNSITITTDEYGKASATIYKGIYQIIITKGGYKGVQTTATMDADGTIEVTLASSSSSGSSTIDKTSSVAVSIMITALLLFILGILAVISLIIRNIPFAIVLIIIMVIIVVLSIALGIFTL